MGLPFSLIRGSDASIHDFQPTGRMWGEIRQSTDYAGSTNMGEWCFECEAWKQAECLLAMFHPQCPHQKVMTNLGKLQEAARLSEQAKEHLHNQTAQGQPRVGKEMKAFAKHHNLPSHPKSA